MVYLGCLARPVCSPVVPRTRHGADLSRRGGSTELAEVLAEAGLSRRSLGEGGPLLGQHSSFTPSAQ
jgi:hypothetical protein